MPIIDRKLLVFLSYSKKDVGIVRALYLQLANEGWMDVWFDEEKLLPGQNWDMEIERAVEDADAVLVCFSNKSVNREGYLQSEVSFILDIARTKPEETIFVIPLRLDECQVPRRLRIWQYVDYFPTSRINKAYQRLLASLELRATKLGLSTVAPVVKKPDDEMREYHLGVTGPKDEKGKEDQPKKDVEFYIDELADRLIPEKHVEQSGIFPNVDEEKSNVQKIPVVLSPIAKPTKNLTYQQKKSSGKTKLLPYGIVGTLLLIGALLLVFMCVISNGYYLPYILGTSLPTSTNSPPIATTLFPVPTDLPLPTDAANMIELSDDRSVINFVTKLSLEDAMKFYREEFGKLNYTERDQLTATSGTTFSMVFDGHESGKAIAVQGVDLGDGTTNISITLANF